MLLLLLACSSVCDRAVDARLTAGETIPDRPAAVAQCEADLHREDEAPWIQALAECKGDVSACVADVSVRRLIGRARAGGDWVAVAQACGTAEASDCPAAVEEGISALTARVTAARDAGADPIEACVDLVRMVEQQGEEVRSAATRLCAEAEAARYATEGAAQAAENLAAGRIELPLACGMGIERLDSLGGEWAQARAKRATAECYGELGKRVLAATVAGESWGCSFDARRVYAAVRDHDVHEPELDSWMDRAAPLCGS